ncbi:expressed unknown protein [Seminavis robusta]|uniref:Uncharacterized protein n=1 Tax=Seminavis robusta TaxID=568900 RepID=A0A9N8E729_9STRA|nr:expressed unknown protein [Seminavis robusta]|eukprot:Sro734_g194780.1 n/a (208) ;mRNA; r:45020-45643
MGSTQPADESTPKMVDTELHHEEGTAGESTSVWNQPISHDATAAAASSDVGLQEMDDFIATYGSCEDDDNNNDGHHSDSFVDDYLREQSNAMVEEIQRQLDEQIQQALQEQIDQQMEDYLQREEQEEIMHADCWEPPTDNGMTADPNLSFLSDRLAKAVRLEAAVPTVAEINADIQKIVDRYRTKTEGEDTSGHEGLQKGSKRLLFS